MLSTSESTGRWTKISVNFHGRSLIALAGWDPDRWKAAPKLSTTRGAPFDELHLATRHHEVGLP